MLNRSLSYRILPYAAIFGCLVTASLSGQTRSAPLPEDLFPELKVILEQAMTQSPAMLQSNLDFAQARAARYAGSASLYPNLSSSVSYSMNTSSPSESTGVTSQADGIYYSLNVYQPIFHWGTLKAQADISKIGVKIAEKNYSEAYRSLALNIRAQFLSLTVLKMRLQNSGFALKVAEDILKLNRNRLEKGTVSAGEIIPLELAVDDAKLALEQAAMDFDNALKVLAQTAGLQSLDADVIPDEIPVAPLRYEETVLDNNAAGFISHGVENTDAAQRLTWGIEQSKLSYKIQKYRLFPKLGFSASISQANSTYATPTAVTQAGLYSESINLTVSWNIFDGFATKGGKLSALASKRTSERALANYLQTTKLQAERQQKQLMLAYRAMRIAEVRRDLALGAVKKAKEDMGRGFASQSEVDQVTVNLNSQLLAATFNRVEFLNRAAEFYSLIGMDPALENLPMNPEGLRK